MSLGTGFLDPSFWFFSAFTSCKIMYAGQMTPLFKTKRALRIGSWQPPWYCMRSLGGIFCAGFLWRRYPMCSSQWTLTDLQIRHATEGWFEQHSVINLEIWRFSFGKLQESELCSYLMEPLNELVPFLRNIPWERSLFHHPVLLSWGFWTLRLEPFSMDMYE